MRYLTFILFAGLRGFVTNIVNNWNLLFTKEAKLRRRTMTDSSAFMLGGNSAAVAMNALRAAASAGIMEGKAPNSMPIYPYAQLTGNTSVASALRPISSPLQGATPFGINDILSRPITTNSLGSGEIDSSALSRSAASPAFAKFPTTMGQNVAMAQAAAMYLGGGGMANCMQSNHGNLYTPKPLAELPGRPPIYWPGPPGDWREKLNSQGKSLLFIAKA